MLHPNPSSKTRIPERARSASRPIKSKKVGVLAERESRSGISFMLREDLVPVLKVSVCEDVFNKLKSRKKRSNIELARALSEIFTLFSDHKVQDLVRRSAKKLKDDIVDKGYVPEEGAERVRRLFTIFVRQAAFKENSNLFDLNLVFCVSCGNRTIIGRPNLINTIKDVREKAEEAKVKHLARRNMQGKVKGLALAISRFVCSSS